MRPFTDEELDTNIAHFIKSECDHSIIAVEDIVCSDGVVEVDYWSMTGQRRTYIFNGSWTNFLDIVIGIK